ncbi:MAG: hypothetical protein K8T90_18490 [Planctomycetes bacterium]|nr:hypothetical protein [Planctomycetota bacterium]
MSRPAVEEWPSEFARYRWEGADLVSSERTEEDRAGRDSLGTPGRIHTVRQTTHVQERRTHVLVRRKLEEAGMKFVSADGDRSEFVLPRVEERAEQVDPFLLEHRVAAIVRGRTFPGQQRAVIEAKAESLRREIEDPSTDPARRAAAEPILRSLEDGLATSVELRSIERRFHPAVAVAAPRESIGSIVPIHAGTRLVYRVNAVDADAGSEGDAEAMVFHVVALGAREAAVLYTGGVHGFRHISDLVGGRAHHAWFSNREKVRTDATAPWVGRKVFEELRDLGASEIIIQRRRDPEPIAIEKIGEDRSFVRIDGRPFEVPVFQCRTSRDDDLVILADPESPLVLRLVESGANLVRTIDAIVSAPGKPFRFAGDVELAAAAAAAGR